MFYGDDSEKTRAKEDEKKRSGKQLLVNSYNSAPLSKKEKERQSNNEK